MHIKPAAIRFVSSLVAGIMLAAGIAPAANAALQHQSSTTTTGTPTSVRTDSTNDTLTITADKSLTGHTFTAVELAKIIDATAVNGEITETAVTTSSSLADSIKKAAKKAGATDDDLKSDPMTWVAKTLADSDTSPYAGKLRDFVTALSNDGDVEKASRAEDAHQLTVSGKTAVLTGEPGIYLVFDDTIGAGAASLPILAATTISHLTNKAGTLGTVDWKALTAPAPEKVLTGINGKAPADPHKGVVNIGDTLTYKITQPIPAMTGYYSYRLSIKDHMSKGLGEPTNLKVMIDGVPVTEIPYPGPIAYKPVIRGNTSGSLDESNNPTTTVGDTVLDEQNNPTTTVKDTVLDEQNNTTTTVGDTILEENNGYYKTYEKERFNEGYVLTVGFGRIYDALPVLKGHKTITVTYETKVTTEARQGTSIENTAALEYSNNPSYSAQTSTVKTPTPVVLYTGGFTIKKTDRQGNPLKGAEFNVLNGTTVMKFTKQSDGVYTPDENGSAAVTSDDNGLIKIDGIANKQVNVKETKSPYSDSQNLLPSFGTTVNVDSTTGKTTLIQTAETDNYGLVTVPTDTMPTTVTVMNVQSLFQMPRTGLAGMLLIAVPLTLMLAAGILVTVKAHRK